MSVILRSTWTVSVFTLVLDNENAKNENFRFQTELTSLHRRQLEKNRLQKNAHAMQIQKLNSQCSQLIQYIKTLATLNKGSNSETFRLEQTTSFFHIIGFQTQYKIDGLAPKLVLQIVNYENSRVLNLMAAEQKLPVRNKFVLWRF